MRKFILACDESGRMGYSNKNEFSIGEFSVVAGVILPHELLSEFNLKLDAILQKYAGLRHLGVKFHITDLESDKEKIRDDIFSLVKENELMVVYSALYVKPLHDTYTSLVDSNKTISENINKHGYSINKNASRYKVSIQSKCFNFMYLQTVCTLISCHMEPVDVFVVTDEVNNKILEEYQSVVRKRHAELHHSSVTEQRFNRNEGKVENITVSVTTHDYDLRDQLLRNSTGNVYKNKLINPIVADVIANSIHYYLKEYIKSTSCGPLNDSDAIKKHPLAENIIGGTKVMDKINKYKHV